MRKKIQIGYLSTSGHHSQMFFHLDPPYWNESSGSWWSNGGQRDIPEAIRIAEAYGISLGKAAVYPAYLWFDTEEKT